MRQNFHRAINVASAILLLAIAFMVSSQFFSIETRYYHHVLLTEIKPNIVKSGDPLTTHVIIERNVPNTCTIEVQRIISEAGTGVVVFSQIAPGIAHMGSDEIVNRLIPIPALPPGKYNYSFRAVSQCPGGIIVLGQSQLAPFTVIK
jgi:hypothetical protein